MGQKYAEYDSTGAIRAFYDSVDSPAPESVTSVVEISDAQWQLCLSNPGYTVVSGALVAPAAPTTSELLAAAQSAKTSALSVACQAAITAGFTSSALGSVYTYPSTLKDQANQNTAANGSGGGLLWCESGSTWALVAHTATQAQGVVTSFAAWLNSCQSQLVALISSVNAATTVAQVQAIAWANP